jgi:DNA-binding GntR family transcriptional regulator
MQNAFCTIEFGLSSGIFHLAMATDNGVPKQTAGLGAATRAHAVADRLRLEIDNGALAPGTRLRQLEIARRLGVSTTPVREAFHMLQREGMVRIDAHRGATVFVPTAEDLHEFYEIRGPLEALAASKAASNFPDEAATELEKLLDEMRDSTDPERYVALNQQFHANLYALSNRPRLTRLIADLRDATGSYLHIYATTGMPTARLDAEHREILAACKARDPQRAAKAVEQHLAHSVEHVASQL